MRKMKKNGWRITAGLLAALLVFPAVPVSAAEKAKLYMSVEENKESEGLLNVSCMLEKGENITNGKIRILYDGEKMRLKETQGGEILQDAMTEINDCVSGNKEEGELVGVFASAKNIGSRGELFDMDFQLEEGIEKGEEIKFEIKAEKLAGDSGDIQTETGETIYVVGEGMKEAEESREDGSQDKETESSGDEKNASASEDKNDKKSSGSGGSQSSNKKSGKVKTGDESPILWYAGCCCGALAVTAGVFVSKKKKKQG